MIQLGLYNRKANLGALRSAVGFEITFGAGETVFRSVDLANVPDLAAKLSIRQRMAFALQRGAMTVEALSGEIDAGADTIRRTARRYRDHFLLLDGGYVGLQARGA